jgi:hypothetical protein
METIQDIKRREGSYQLINSALTLGGQTRGGSDEKASIFDYYVLLVLNS